MGSLGRTTDLGKLNLVDNLLDGTIVVVWLMRMLDFLEVETGFAVKVCHVYMMLWCVLYDWLL